MSSHTMLQMMLQIFYYSVVIGAFLHAIMSWSSSVKVGDANRFNKLIMKTELVLGDELDPIVTVAERRILFRLWSIIHNSTHPLHSVLVGQKSIFSQRLINIKCTTKHLLTSVMLNKRHQMLLLRHNIKDRH